MLVAADAAEALKITAPDLFKFGIVDSIIPEPSGGAHALKRTAATNSPGTPVGCSGKGRPLHAT